MVSGSSASIGFVRSDLIRSVYRCLTLRDTAEQLIGGALDAAAAAVEDVGIHHGGLHIAVSEQFFPLPADEWRKSAQRVWTIGLGDCGPAPCLANRALWHGLVKMMPSARSGAGSTESVDAGKTHCQPHSRSALGYVRPFKQRARRWLALIRRGRGSGRRRRRPHRAPALDRVASIRLGVP